jgi:hypothetical protein
MAEVEFTTRKEEEILDGLGLRYPNTVVLVAPTARQELYEKGFSTEQIREFGTDYSTYSDPDVSADRVFRAENRHPFVSHVTQAAEKLDITDL